MGPSSAHSGLHRRHGFRGPQAGSQAALPCSPPTLDLSILFSLHSDASSPVLHGLAGTSAPKIGLAWHPRSPGVRLRPLRAAPGGGVALAVSGSAAGLALGAGASSCALYTLPTAVYWTQQVEVGEGECRDGKCAEMSPHFAVPGERKKPLQPCAAPAYGPMKLSCPGFHKEV